MRVLLLSVCLALSACASPNWVNPRNPAANLQADTTACEKDAERVGRLNQLAGQPAGGCFYGRGCTADAENQQIRIAAEATVAQKRCMVARGWRQV